MTLFECLDKVKDRESFLDFVRALIRDRENSAEWQNDSIESYFEAALACVEDNSERDDILKVESWRTFAEFLYADKIYE